MQKVTYTDGQTVISARNLNDIQDEIISLRNDVDEIEDEMPTATSNRLNENVEFYTLNYAGNCTFVYVKDYGWGLIDLGVSASKLVSFKTNHGITSLKFLVISHYHWDHSGTTSDTEQDGRFPGLKALVESGVSLNGCKVIRPHQSIDWTTFGSTSVNSSGQTYTVLKVQEDELIRYATEQGATLVTATTEDTVLNLCNNVDLHFFNVDGHGYDYYVNLDNGYIGHNGKPAWFIAYNNFSMITVLKCGRRTAVFPGDIEQPAQDRNLPALKYGCDFYMMNHHAHNTVESTTWFNNLSPRYVVVGQYDSKQDKFHTLRNAGISRMISAGSTILCSRYGIAGVKIVDGDIGCMVGSSYVKPLEFPTAHTNRSGSPLIASIAPSDFITNGQIDLNKVIHPGVYYTEFEADTTALLNRPSSVNSDSWKLEVSDLGVGWGVLQTLTENYVTGYHEWRRVLKHKNGTSWEFGDWVSATESTEVNISNAWVLAQAEIKDSNSAYFFIPGFNSFEYSSKSGGTSVSASDISFSDLRIYRGGEKITLSGFTLSSVTISQIGLYGTITKTGAFDGYNQGDAMMYGYLTLNILKKGAFR